jgi:hypothetical protein
MSFVNAVIGTLRDMKKRDGRHRAEILKAIEHEMLECGYFPVDETLAFCLALKELEKVSDTRRVVGGKTMSERKREKYGGY